MGVIKQWPPIDQLVALLVMVGHARHFEAQMVYKDSPFLCPSHLCDVRRQTHEKIKELVEFWPALSSHVTQWETVLRTALTSSDEADNELQPLVAGPSASSDAGTAATTPTTSV